MSLLSEYTLKAGMVVNRKIPGEQRVFAALELVCQPLSFLTILGIAGLPLLSRCGVVPPRWFADRGFPILVSAAVGYLTNWIAIEMLFKPYDKTWRHGFPLMTFGYWKQGLVPKNKDRISVVMGEQVATKLLQPEKLADDLCSMAGGMLDNPNIVVAVIVEQGGFGSQSAVPIGREILEASFHVGRYAPDAQQDAAAGK